MSLMLPISAVCQTSLYFYNPQTNKVVTAQKGEQLVVLYKGYNGQTEFFKEIITDITDSTITLGNDHSKSHPLFAKSQKDKIKKFGPGFKTISIKDIQAFRKISIARLLSKAAVQIGSVVGLLFLVEYIYDSPDISTSNSFALSLSAGVLTKTIVALSFPEDVKYEIKDGWQITTVKPQALN